MNERGMSFDDENIKDYYEEKYSDSFYLDENISKNNRRNNQKSDRDRMIVDGAGLKDTFRIKRERYIKKYGRE